MSTSAPIPEVLCLFLGGVLDGQWQRVPPGCPRISVTYTDVYRAEILTGPSGKIGWVLYLHDTLTVEQAIELLIQGYRKPS